MWRSVLLAMFFVGLASACAQLGYPQASAPKMEIYGGVTKLWGHANGANFDDGGGEVSATGYINRFIGFEGNFEEFNYSPPDAPGYGSHYSMLFGPHFTYHNRWVTPFAHVLVGVARGDAAGANYTTLDRSAFAFAVGGGLDVKIWRILWVRLIQADYLREYFPGDPDWFSRALENNRRLSGGFVIRFGSLQRR